MLRNLKKALLISILSIQNKPSYRIFMYSECTCPLMFCLFSKIRSMYLSSFDILAHTRFVEKVPFCIQRNLLSRYFWNLHHYLYYIRNLNPKFKNWYWNSGTEQTQLAWPFTPNKMVMLQYDEVFFRLTTPAALPTFAGAESLQKPHHIS